MVNPDTGDYIIFNLSSEAATVQNQSGFPGTTNVGTVDGDAVIADQGAGTSFQYNQSTDSYSASATSVPCFVAGTHITTPSGEVAVETLKIGDLVMTKDNGPQEIRWIGVRHLTQTEISQTGQHPIAFKPGSLGAGKPLRELRVSPQHRILIEGDVLAPARGMTDLPRIRVMKGCQLLSPPAWQARSDLRRRHRNRKSFCRADVSIKVQDFGSIGHHEDYGSVANTRANLFDRFTNQTPKQKGVAPIGGLIWCPAAKRLPSRATGETIASRVLQIEQLPFRSKVSLCDTRSPRHPHCIP